MSRRRRIALLVVVCVQLAVPLAMAGLVEADLAFGDEIKLKAQPVDPLDVFRGNYVVLTYEISRLQVIDDFQQGRTGSAPTYSSRRPASTARVGRTPTRRGARGRSAAAPADDVRAGESVGIEYGIETYYASAERAREIESAIARGQLYVVVDLDDDGSARIKRLEFDE